jgi:hypothetical protein
MSTERPEAKEISFNPTLYADEIAKIKTALVAHGASPDGCVEQFLRWCLHALLNQTRDGKMTWFPARFNMRGEEAETLRWRYELAEKQLAIMEAK